MTGTAHNLLTNYLKGRQQKTTINNAISDIHPITYGVPQGSILGPTLFVIYINDLPSVITHSIIFMYADDTALTVSRKETKAASILIQRDLNKVNQWMCSNKLNLNAKKSQYLVRVSECWRFYAVSTARVIFTAKTSLDLFSLSREQVWTFSSLG